MAVPNYLSLYNTVLIAPGGSGTTYPDGYIGMISAGTPGWSNTLQTPAFSTMTGSTLTTGVLSMSTLIGSTLTLNTMTANSTIQPSTLSLYGASLEKVHIHPTGVSWFNGGNVGIGTSQPQTALDVSGITTVSQLNMTGLTTGPSGFATELTNILNMNLNFRGTPNTANLGAAFRIDGRDITDTPLFQWIYRPASGVDVVIANMTKTGKLSLGKGPTEASYMLDTQSSDPIQINMNRTGAATNYGAGILYSLTTPAGNKANYCRTFGSIYGAPATSQATANGMYVVDVATAGAFATDGDWVNSALVVSPTKSWFNTTVGIGTSTPATGVKLHVNGPVRNRNPSWFGYNVNATDVATNTVVTYNTLGAPTVNCSFSTGGNGRATITVPGRYYVFFSGFAANDAATSTQHFIRKNSGLVQRCWNGSKTSGGYGPSMSQGVVMDLVVDDYIDVYIDLSSFHGNLNCYFGGYMIG